MKKLLYTLSLSTLLLSVTGCEEALNTEPKQSISADVALQDITGVRSLLISVYDRLQGADYYGARFMLGPDALADNATVTNAQSNRYLTWTINNFGVHFNIWGNNYGVLRNR